MLGGEFPLDRLPAGSAKPHSKRGVIRQSKNACDPIIVARSKQPVLSVRYDFAVSANRGTNSRDTHRHIKQCFERAFTPSPFVVWHRHDANVKGRHFIYL